MTVTFSNYAEADSYMEGYKNGFKRGFKPLVCYDFIKTFRKKLGKNPPYPVFVFRTAAGLVCGEYDPRDAWTGDSDVLDREIAYWYISWDQQDVDVVQFWIIVKDKAKENLSE